MTSKRKRLIALDEATAPYKKQHQESDSGFDKYKIIRTLNRGSFGIVNLVCLSDDPTKKYACKQLSLDEAKYDVIKKEVDLIRKAVHRHVVNIVDIFTDQHACFQIVMTPAADYDLAKYLRHKVQSPSSSSWKDFGEQRLMLFQWMYCLATAIEYIHGLNIRHRDLKPDNILVHGDRIFITDFGTSFQSSDNTRYTITSTPGSAKYLPPEAKDNNRFGRKGDIFSLGCVFWEMAEALSDPVLKVKFPRVIGTYSSSVCIYTSDDSDSDVDDSFLHKMDLIEESKIIRRRLPEHYQLGDSFRLLLSLIFHMMQPSPDYRFTAKKVVSTFDIIVKEAQCTPLSCCFNDLVNRSCITDTRHDTSDDPVEQLTDILGSIPDRSFLLSGFESIPRPFYDWDRWG